ncbi:CLUMA_CG019374, isoform A [Clunio marinus]|uniref:CLUMA_CG019374, isoform A n=1 Tax=Clunio marinus TaxID=568069 RepID=A0A1J1J025_9DIPT|nr:CLUMA_CG019374, isoform A [Clunio marinus]
MQAFEKLLPYKQIEETWDMKKQNLSHELNRFFAFCCPSKVFNFVRERGPCPHRLKRVKCVTKINKIEGGW